MVSVEQALTDAFLFGFGVALEREDGSKTLVGHSDSPFYMVLVHEELESIGHWCGMSDTRFRLFKESELDFVQFIHTLEPEILLPSDVKIEKGVIPSLEALQTRDEGRRQIVVVYDSETYSVEGGIQEVYACGFQFLEVVRKEVDEEEVGHPCIESCYEQIKNAKTYVKVKYHPYAELKDFGDLDFDFCDDSILAMVDHIKGKIDGRVGVFEESVGFTREETNRNNKVTEIYLYAHNGARFDSVMFCFSKV